MQRLCLALVMVAGCAHGRDVRLEETPVGTGVIERPDAPEWVPPPGVEDPKDHAARALASERCELNGRPLMAVDDEEAWQWLRACVEAGRFTALRSLLEGPWDPLLRGRPDAPELLARIIALRGGDVDKDLGLLHARRIPLFALRQAAAQPALYRGHYVVVRARMRPVRADRVLIDESRLVGTRRGAVSWRLVGGWRLPQRRPAPNVEVPTGARALGQLPAPDPFVPEEPVIVLARFDGLDDAQHPTLTVLAWHRPHPGLAY